MNRDRKSLGTGGALFVLLWIVLFVASVSLLFAFLSAFFGPSGRTVVSLDWSGYAVVSDYNFPSSVVTNVAGSWSVPQVSVSIGDTFSAAWIGIGGQLDNTLIQTGTEHDSINGVAEYSAWYELLPNDSITITTINVSPGDEFEASIGLVDSDTNEWSIEIVDVTNGQSFQEIFFYDSSMLSAEWIVERPTVSNSLSILANFGSITFTNSSATVNGNVGRINSFPFYRTLMHDRQNRQLVTVSSLSSDGSSFTVQYSGSSVSMSSQIAWNKATYAFASSF